MVLQVVGQSYSIGLGVEASQRASTLLAGYLGAEEKNFGVSGAVLYYSKVSGGYATVANKLTRTSATYVRGTDYGLVWFGGNDLYCMDSTFSSASQAHLKSVFRFAISRMCAGKIYDDEDASIAYSGFVKSSELGESKVTGKYTHYTSTNGSKVTISVPSSFPGGTVAVYLNAENGTGGTWTFKVDGASAGEQSTKYTYGVSALSMFCKRFTGLAPGAHTIELTVNSITTYAAFDSWAIEAPTPPTVIVPGQFMLNSYGTGETHNPVDADVTALEKLIKEACEEFGSYVKFVSLSSMDHTTHVQADQVHPTAQGHEEIFALMKTALEAGGAESVEITPPPAVAKAIAPVATIETTSNATIEPPAAVAKVVAASPNVESGANATVEPPPAMAKAVAPAPTIEASTNVTVEPPAAVATAGAAAPTIEISSTTSVTIEPPAAVAKAVAPQPTVTTSSTSSVTIEPPAAIAKATAPVPTISVGSTGGEPAPSVVVVREHVPCRLAVIIRAADGTKIGRWSQGESSIGNVFGNLTKDGDMPGGHKELSCILYRDPRRSYPDLATFARLELQGAGGEVLWSGTIRQQPQDGDRGTIEVKAVGDRQLLEDDEQVIGPGFINCDLSRWAGASTTRRHEQEKADQPIQHDAAATPDAQGDAALHMEVQGAWASPAIPGCEGWFHGQGVPLGTILADWKNGNADTNFVLNIAFCDDDSASSFEQTGDLYNATTGHISVSSSVPRGYVLIGWSYNATANGVDGLQFAVDLVNLKVLSKLAASLTLQGTWPNVGFLAKQMIPYIIDGSGLTTKDELLEDDGFIIPQAWFSDPSTRMAKLVEVTKYGQLDWYVFNDRLFQYRFPGTYGRKWRLAPGAARPRNSGTDGQRVWERFMVTFQDVDGTTKRIGPPGSGADIEDARLQSTDPRNAAVAQGNPRGKLIALGGKSEVEPAIKTALRFKEEAEQLDQSGEVTISGHVQDAASGAWYPAAHVQPGDWVADPGTSNYRKITGAPYGDDSKSGNYSIGAPSEGGLAALEERTNAKLLERGLT